MVCRGRAEYEAPGNSEQLTDDLESVAELVREFPIKVSVLWTEKRRQRLGDQLEKNRKEFNEG